MKLIGFTAALTLFLDLASTGISSPLRNSSSVEHCTNPIVRKEWRSLTRHEQKKYIKAINCLQKLPAITKRKVPGAISRFDDFQGEHILATDFIHYVGQFLPWHRYFVAVYEKRLREECGYDGGQPYWDWTLDYEDWENASIWDAETGFGGNGVPVNCSATSLTCLPGGTGGGCITNGPFSDTVLHVGPADSIIRNDRCLTRDFNAGVATVYFNPTAMNTTMSQPTFESFRKSLEGLQNDINSAGQHGAGHVATGGAMLDFYASPGDPLFFLHHGQLDKLWWDWQSMDIENRLYALSGPTRAILSSPNAPNVTLDYMLDVGILGDQVPIRDVMDIRGSLCYTYK